MPHHPNTRVCTHVKVTGHRCGSPALRGEQFCYFHQRMMRGVPTPPDARMHPIALIENEEAIQASIMEVINALARNTIDTRRAELILRALHIAVKNAGRTKFHSSASDMVREVPDYPAPDPPIRPERATASSASEIVLDGGAPSLRTLQRWDPTTQNAAPINSTPTSTSAQTEANSPSPILARSWEAMLKEASDRCEGMNNKTPNNAVTNSAVTSNTVTTNNLPRTESSTKEKSAINPTQRKPPARAGLPATERTVRKKG